MRLLKSKTSKKAGAWRGIYLCDCGKEIETRMSAVAAGHVKSCGCLQRRVCADRLRKHGLHGSPEYLSWQSMIDRCTNKNRKDFNRYGGRGISVCDKWLKFEAFFSDMGLRTVNQSLDRIDNNSNYGPENCRWATMKEQTNNRSSNKLITFNGQIKTVQEWADNLNIKRWTIINRLKLGWPIEDVLMTPVRHCKSRKNASV